MKSLTNLVHYLGESSLPQLCKEGWDDIMVAHMTELFAQGSRPNDGETLMAALAWRYPALGRPLRLVFPRATRAVKGWARHEPALSKAPLPWTVVAAMASHLVHNGHKRIALLILMLFETYARPSSLLRTEGQHLLPPHPVARTRWWCFLLNPFELATPGKVNEYDNSVALDLPRHRKYAGLLAELKAHTLPTERLWHISYG